MTVRAADVIALAEKQLGKPYVFGASGTDSFDCSSLVQYVYRQFGISLPRVTYDQVKVGQHIPQGQQQPGDLIFSDWGDGPNSHVALYIGNNKVIEAPQPGENVEISDYVGNYPSHTTAIRRLLDPSGQPLDTSGVTTAPAFNYANATAATESGGGGLLFEMFKLLNPTNAVNDLRQFVNAAGRAIASVANLGEWLFKITYPPMQIRIFAGIGAVIFFLLGLIMLMGEVRDA